VKIRKRFGIGFLFLAVLFWIWFLSAVDIRTGKLFKARVLYGTIENEMVSVKAAARADYLFKSVRSGILRPIPDNVHDLLFFPVAVEDLQTMQAAIVTYSPWYPFWAGASPVFNHFPYDRMRGFLSESEYNQYAGNVQCMIIGNGLFSTRLDNFELWYFEKKE
jgi:hypothetical protein